jgi:hypothetical protein
VVWARADGPSMAQRRSLGIHAERPTPRHLHSASRRAFGGVLRIFFYPIHLLLAIAVRQTNRHRGLAVLGGTPPRALLQVLG